MNRKIKISGSIENEIIKTPEDSPSSENGEKNPLKDILGNLNKSPEALDNIIKEFLNNFLNSGGKNLPKDMEDHFSINENEEDGTKKFVFDDQALDFIIKNSETNTSDVDEESNKKIVTYDETTNTATSNLAYNFSVLAENESFGSVTCEKEPDIYNHFLHDFGNGPYPMTMFSQKMIGYNLISALSDIESIEYLEHTNKYILFKGIPFSTDTEPFIISMILQKNEFCMIVPRYGNTYDQLTDHSFNRILDTHLYKVEEGQLSVSDLNDPIDMERIKVGLEMVLLTPEFALTRVKDFGEILPSLNAVTMSNDRIFIGKIKSNELRETLLFKMDFNLDQDERLFNFYIKLKKVYSKKTLNNLIRFLSEINFKTNEKILCQELKVDSNKDLYIDLDLDGLPDNIDNWVN